MAQAGGDSSTAHLLPLVRAGVLFVDRVPQRDEGETSESRVIGASRAAARVDQVELPQTVRRRLTADRVRRLCPGSGSSSDRTRC